MLSLPARLLALLTPKEKSGGLVVVLFLILSALLDFAGLASLLPIIFLITDINWVERINMLQWLTTTTGLYDMRVLYVAILTGLIALVFLKNIVNNAITRQKARYVFDLGSAISSRLLGRYLAQPWMTFTQSDHSKEINRIANQPIAFANNVVMPLGTILSEGIIFVILLIVVLIFNPTAFLFFSALLIPVFGAYLLRRQNQRKLGTDLTGNYGKSLKHAGQAVDGLPEVRAFDKVEFFENRFQQSSRAFADASAFDHSMQARSSRTTEVIAVTAVCSIIIYGVFFQSNYRETITLLAIYAGVSFRLLPSMNRVLHGLTQIRTHEHLFDEIEISPVLPIVNDQGKEVYFHSNIRLNAISFQYPDAQPTLTDLSIEFLKGEKLALTGKSGSGKTTLLLILLRFLQPSTGSFTIDGEPVESFSLASFRRLIAYVPQNPYLLDATLAENIAFGIAPDLIDEKRIHEIMANLDMTDMVAQLPTGLATRIGENGIRLSGGQRQRVSIARALYADAEILLLDEVTSQLDDATEQEILMTLQKLVTQNKTIIMITHHTSLLQHFDVVINFEDGKVISNRTKAATHV